MFYGDGYEERANATALALRLNADPKVRARREKYLSAVATARSHASSLTQEEIIQELKAHNPAYLESFLRSEDERFGSGSLAERYARTFWAKFQQAK